MSDIRLIVNGTPIQECSDKERRELYAAFVTAYYVALKHDVATKPEQFGWRDKSDEEVMRVVVRMMTAIHRGSAANSNALKRAAKQVGLNGSMIRALVVHCFESAKGASDETIQS